MNNLSFLSYIYAESVGTQLDLTLKQAKKSIEGDRLRKIMKNTFVLIDAVILDKTDDECQLASLRQLRWLLHYSLASKILCRHNFRILLVPL